MVIIIKRVGIILREFKENNISFIGTRLDIFNAISKFDVEIIGIPINIEFSKIKNILQTCQGIILSGGERICANDYLIIDYLVKNNIPTLGICLGMQAMALYFSDQSEIDVNNHYTTQTYAHKIFIKEGTLLYKILNKKEIIVNSRHHSAIPKTNLKVSAKSSDNVIEAVELNHHKFFLGLEWHPESLEDNNSYQIFRSFINHL